MNRFRLATSATLLGVVLATGCASPCGGCGGGFRRMSLFGGRRACPCECCSNCGSGGAPIVGGGMGMGMDWGEGPFLEPPSGPPLAGIPPSAALPPSSPLLTPGGIGAPAPFPPSLGAPFGTPTMPVDPRLSPIPNGAAQPLPAEASSRIGRR